MKKVLSLIAFGLICSHGLYAMEQETKANGISPTCTTCGIKVGGCDWGALAANLGVMHTGPVQPEIDYSRFPKKDHEEKSLELQKAAIADAAKRAETSVDKTKSLEDDWDNISDDWEYVTGDGNQKK